LGFAGLSGGGSSSTNDEDKAEETPPDLIRDSFVDSGSDTDSSTDMDSDDDDDSSLSSTPPSTAKPRQKRRVGVSFSEAVVVQPIPHSSTLSPLQRCKMYTSSLEVRRNKIRNKKEFRYDGYDWRNSTEEWEMGVDMVTGELIHPAHETHLA